jgi:hypothetical protein
MYSFKQHLTLLLSLLILTACKQGLNTGNDYANDFFGPKYHFDTSKNPSAPVYSDIKSWMLLPDETGNNEIDLIWLYPTTFVSDSLWNMPLDDENAKAGALADFQAMSGIFDDCCDIYAPYYRQACLAVLSADSNDFDAAFELALNDVNAAINYYFENFNNQRRFVLAGHSQGAAHLLEILKYNEKLKQNIHKMVVAYVVGWSVVDEDILNYPHLKICDSPTEQNCIISYNTIEDGFQTEAATLTLFPNSITVNPLLWTTGDEFAPKELHMGAVFPNTLGFDTIYKYTSAFVKNGLCVERPDNVDDFIVFEPYFYPGIYHVYDYEFFHLNLKSNLKERIRAR